MTEPSVAPPAHTPTPTEVLAERVEQELERLRASRPELEGRIDRAASILVMQLSSPAHQRPMRVRAGSGGTRVLVASASQGGVVYSVDPAAWTCSCPDHHRRGGACKHAVAAYVLQRAATRRGCRLCHGGVHYLTVEVDGQEQMVPVTCRRCGGAE